IGLSTFQSFRPKLGLRHPLHSRRIGSLGVCLVELLAEHCDEFEIFPQSRCIALYPQIPDDWLDGAPIAQNNASPETARQSPIDDSVPYEHAFVLEKIGQIPQYCIFGRQPGSGQYFLALSRIGEPFRKLFPNEALRL